MASDLNIFPIQALSDNYIWCIHDGCYAVVVDPGDAAPVIESLNKHGLRLDAILITHHHADHTAGIQELASVYKNVPVIGPKNSKTKGLTHLVAENETVSFANLDMPLRVLEVPGHTLDHVAYYSDTALFCGDTLFCAGCGRIFEGTPEQMWSSLQKLCSLPDTMQVYCTHEYTLANLNFAHAVEPNNDDIKTAIESVKQLRSAGLPSLPSNLALERSINPFLRADLQENWPFIEKHTQQKVTNSVSAFAAIRGWKDKF